MWLENYENLQQNVQIANHNLSHRKRIRTQTGSVGFCRIK